jgi:hypothetical protein
MESGKRRRGKGGCREKTAHNQTANMKSSPEVPVIKQLLSVEQKPQLWRDLGKIGPDSHWAMEFASKDP